MQFVDEHNRAGAFQFVNDALQAFFELSAVHRTCHQRTDVQLQHAFIQQQAGHVAFDNALGQPLDDGGLAHAGLANQRRVILGAARQNLDDALNFFLAPDDRVQFAIFRQGGQVCGELVHQRCFAAFFFLAAGSGSAGGAGWALLEAGRGRLTGVFLAVLAGFRNYPAGLPANLFGRGAQAFQHFHAFANRVAREGEKQMLCADRGLPAVFGFFQRQFQHALGIAAQHHIAGMAAQTGFLFDCRANGIQFHPHVA